MFKIKDNFKNEFGEELENIKSTSNESIDFDSDIIKPFEQSVNNILNSYCFNNYKVKDLVDKLRIEVLEMLNNFDDGLITKLGIDLKVNNAIPKIKEDYNRLVTEQNKSIETINKKLNDLIKIDIVSLKNHVIRNRPDIDKLNHIKEIISYLPSDVITDLYHNSFSYGTVTAATWYHALMIMGHRDIANTQPTLPLMNIINPSSLHNGTITYHNFEDFLVKLGIVRDFKDLSQYTLSDIN